MRFEANMRGQNVAINYGTNPMGEVAGVWVELANGGHVVGLTAEDEAVSWALASVHNAQQQIGIDAGSVNVPLVIEFVLLVNRLVSHLPEPQRADRLMAVVGAIRDESPGRADRIANVLFPHRSAA